LLVSSFSGASAEHFRTSSYWGPRPTHRLWLEDQNNAIVAHLDLETRTIQVGDDDVLVAGIGEVATAPHLQGSGIGRRLMAELQQVLQSDVPVSFGILQCGDQVIGFYETTGWQRIDAPVRAIHPDSGQWETITNNVLITPGTLPVTAWPEGPVDLRGLLW
jgi:aminoglycoside 2'-N-acetyltransferase I